MSHRICYEHVYKQGKFIVGPIYFCIWILFFLTFYFCSFSLALLVTFSSFDFLWHATDYWQSNVNKNGWNTFHCICFALNAMMKNDYWMKLHSNSSKMKIWLNEPENVGRKFDQEQTSPNIVQHNFCLLFLFL